jgi:hypothetical protein
MPQHDYAAIIAEEAQARAQRAASAVREGRATQAQAEADAAIWRALAHWATHPTWKGAQALRTPPACGWEVATRATDAAARAALKTYLDAGGDEARPRTLALTQSGQRWAGLNALAWIVEHHALEWLHGQERKAA